MSSFVQYPDKQLNDAKTTNIVVFSSVLSVLGIILFLLVTTLCCMFFCFRKYSLTFSKKAKDVKREVISFNSKNSSALTKNQRTLRYLASHSDFEDKYRVLSTDGTNTEEENEESPFQDTDGKMIEKEQQVPPPEYNFLKTYSLN